MVTALMVEDVDDYLIGARIYAITAT